MRRLRVLLVALCGLACGISAALAETRVALVVGNSAYQSTTPLANPLNDARDMAAALKSVGFDVVEALDADKRKLDGAMRAFTDKLANADVALFFYAGHGLQVGLQNYLVPIDATPTERDHIVEVLRHSGGVISGNNGAAARLGMKRTTLQYKMSKLGIAQKRVCAQAGD